ncbi:hypothetical protein BWQ96_01451 [Gracilariopsis chorda]|uniref:Uncharacterized protein n=1 Tax=Gracilariopsis chorda TaxID=448386 RepID=A0A2V3J2J5_9FLOR|nr:hypothetical protein BWQ96_01451 [Gracilariopsis chorda]|eukprot:PXF48599.1 hypothetical protein BWQ96_01451 [Gracilariopsis chorda]
MGTKRLASDATRSTTPRQTTSAVAKRLRTTLSGQSKPISPPPPATPARPPRIPRCCTSSALDSTHRSAVNRLDGLNAQQIIALLNKVEMRFRRLAVFEAEEIRRAQMLGYATSATPSTHSPYKLALHTAAW